MNANPNPKPRRKATSTDQFGAGALATIAVGFLGAATTEGIDAASGISGFPKLLVYLLGIFGLLTAAASIYFGVLGVTRGVVPGPGNAFDRQAKLIGLSFTLLVAGLSVATFYRTTDVSDIRRQVEEANARLAALQQDVTARFAEIEVRLNELQGNTQTIGEQTEGLARDLGLQTETISAELLVLREKLDAITPSQDASEQE